MSLREAEEITLREFTWEMYAHELKRVDQEFQLALSAWYNQAVKATKKNKPLYKTFEDFFDYDGTINKIKNPSVYNKDSTLKNLLLASNSQ